MVAGEVRRVEVVDGRAEEVKMEVIWELRDFSLEVRIFLNLYNRGGIFVMFV